MSGAEGIALLTEQVAEWTGKFTHVHRLCSCMLWPGSHWYPLHITAIFAYVYTLHKTSGCSYRFLLQVPCPFPPRFFPPRFVLHTSCSAQRLSTSVTISQTWKGALAAGRSHPSDNLARAGATITPLDCSTNWGLWSPGVAELPHRALATRTLFHS